jgi:hypothetical protein
MGERPDAIAEHIRKERQELSDDIRELEIDVRNAADWRTQVKKRPFAAMLIGVLGGMLLFAILRR